MKLEEVLSPSDFAPYAKRYRYFSQKAYHLANMMASEVVEHYGYNFSTAAEKYPDDFIEQRYDMPSHCHVQFANLLNATNERESVPVGHTVWKLSKHFHEYEEVINNIQATFTAFCRRHHEG